MIEHIFSRIKQMPLIPVLRGIRPDQIDDVIRILQDLGYPAIEITLDSPDWQHSLELVSSRYADTMLLFAGSVLTTSQVEIAKQNGALAIFSPNLNAEVVQKSRSLGLLSVPGCFTPTECFQALELGAHLIKLFPAITAGPAHIKSIRAVLPGNARLCATGGVTPTNLPAFFNAGVFAAGIGSDLFSPTKSTRDIANAAQQIADGWHDYQNQMAD